MKDEKDYNIIKINYQLNIKEKIKLYINEFSNEKKSVFR